MSLPCWRSASSIDAEVVGMLSSCCMLAVDGVSETQMTCFCDQIAWCMASNESFEHNSASDCCTRRTYTRLEPVHHLAREGSLS